MQDPDVKFEYPHKNVKFVVDPSVRVYTICAYLERQFTTLASNYLKRTA